MRQAIATAGIIGLLAIAPACAEGPNEVSEVPKPTGKYDNVLVQSFGYTGEVMTENAEIAKENSERSVSRMAGGVRDSFHRTADHIKKWWFTRPANPGPQAIPSSYCYRVLQDILCYRAPMPGWEYRLVAYQGTYAQPPAPAQMQPLPAKKETAGEHSQTPTPEHVADAAPVFKEMPAEKEDEPEKEEEVVPEADAAHETLPDPALAPQL